VNLATADLLLDEIRLALGVPGLGFRSPAEPLTGGYFAELFVLHFDDDRASLPADVVARVSPDPILAAGETIVQQTAAQQGFPTPMIHLSGGPDGPVGRSWSVMDVAPGAPLLSGLSGLGALAKLPTLARRLPAQLGQISAALHRLDPEPIRHRLAELDGRQVDLDDQLALMAHRAERSDDRELIELVRRVTATRPATSAAVVCHGDLHPFNVLADGDRLTLLDWTSSLIAPPLYDVAFTALVLSNPPVAMPPRLRPIVSRAGGWLSKRFLDDYQRRAATTIDRIQLDWFTSVHLARTLCELASWDFADSRDRRLDHPWRLMAPMFRQRLRAAV